MGRGVEADHRPDTQRVTTRPVSRIASLVFLPLRSLGISAADDSACVARYAYCVGGQFSRRQRLRGAARFSGGGQRVGSDVMVIVWRTGTKAVLIAFASGSRTFSVSAVVIAMSVCPSGPWKRSMTCRVS